LKFIIQFCFLWFFSINILAQDFEYIRNPRLDKVDISKGLSQNVIIDLTIDRNGFLWLGTMDGLNKYDGYNFKVYKKEFKVDSNYVNNFIHKVWTDSKSNVWLIKEDGAFIIDNLNKKIEKIFINKEIPSRFAQADSDSIWVLTRSQNLYKVNISDKKFRPVAPKLKSLIVENEDWIANVIPIQNNEIIITTVRGHIIHHKNSNTTLYKIPNVIDKKFNSAFLVDTENIWMSSFNGFVFKFNLKSHTFERVDQNLLGTNHTYLINCIYHDKHLNSIWISSQRAGLLKYDLKTQKLAKYVIKAPRANIINSENILSLVRDPSTDVLYLGTDQHGLLVWDPYLYKFDLIDAEQSSESQLGFRLPRKLEKDNYGNIWIGSVNTGLWRYNVKNEKLDVFTTSTHPEILNSNSSVQLLHQNDTLWIGHNGSGITKLLLPKMKKLDHFRVKGKEKELDNINVIWNLIKDSKNRLWIGTRTSGVYIKNGKEVQTINKYNSVLEDNVIYSITEDPDKNIIITTQKGGLYKYNIKTADIEKVFPKKPNSKKFSSKSLIFDKNGYIWYATDGKGLFVLDKDYNILSQANTDNNVLKNDAICSMILHDDNSVWASTNYGLYRLNFDQIKKTISSKIYTAKDGLTSNEFMTGAYLKTNDTLWMGNMEGVNYFVPSQLPTNIHPPKVYIKNIEINNQTTEDLQQLTHLDNTEDNIAFEYNTIGYTIPEKTFYSYRLIGYDTIWSKPSTRTFSRYTNLKFGEYQFEVKARNYDGIWNKNPIKIAFKIPPSIFQTLGFQILALLFGFTAIVLLYKNRIKSIKKEENLKNKYLKDITEMEMRALRAQINPHFLFNTLNSINSFILQQDGETASRYLVKFSKLMRLILSHSTHSYISLTDEFTALNTYIELEGMRFNNNFDYFLNIDNSIDLNKVKIPPMLLQPFVENAIWHGLMHKDGEKVLSIEILPEPNNMISIKIRDNGIGRKAANQRQQSMDKRKSFGMDITKKRIELLNQELPLANHQKPSIEIIDLLKQNLESDGTEVIVNIPISISSAS